MTMENVENGNGSTVSVPEPTEPVIGTRVKGLRIADPDNFTLIGLDTDDKEGHPLHDERVHLPVNMSLAKNMMELGVLEPILCRENGDRLEVIAGRQRVKAAREANRLLKAKGEKPITMPYLVKRPDDAEAMGMMLSENTQRQDDDVMLKAEKAARFMKLEPSIDKAATYFGVDKQTINMWLKLRELHPEVRHAVKEGKIAATAAAKLHKLTKEEQYEQLNEIFSKGTTATNAVVEHEVKKARKKKAGKKTDDDALAPLTHGQIRKLLKYWEENSDDVKPEVMNFARVVVGEVSPKKVTGMAKSLRAAGVISDD